MGLDIFQAGFAQAETVSWISNSGGDWSNGANWSTGSVPTVSDDVVIDRPGIEITVTANQNVAVKSVSSKENLSIINGIFQLQSGGTVEGTFSLLNASLLRVLSGQFFATGTTDITNARFEISGGATVNLPNARTYNFQGISPGINVALVDGAGSKLNLSAVESLRSGSTSGYAYSQFFQASNGAKIDFSGVKLIDNTATGNGYPYFNGKTGGTITFDSLEQISGGTYLTTFELDSQNNPLPKLKTASSLSLKLKSGALVTLPQLQSFGDVWSTLDVPTGASLSLPLVTAIKRTGVTVGGIINAPQVTSINYSILTLAGGSLFNSGQLNNIDETRFFLSGGVVFSKIIATSYNFQQTWVDPAVISVKGPGTKLDLSSVKTVKGGHNYGWNSFQLIEATDGGIVDLSQTTLIDNLTYGAVWVKFASATGGKILLDALKTIQGTSATEFSFPGESTPLPNLEQVSNIQFTLPAGATLSLPKVSTLSAGYFVVPTGATISFPLLTAFQSTNFIVDGTVNAPLATSLTSSSLTLKSGSQFNSGQLTNIDNTRFFLSGGVVFNKISALSYNIQNTWVDPAIISLKDPGTKLDLSSVKTFQGGYNYGWPATQVIEAVDGALLDFSQLTLIDNLTYGAVWVKFASSNGGKILFSSLKKIQGYSATEFALQGETNPLPALEEISNINVGLPPGTNISFPSVTSLGSGSFSVPAGTTMSFPGLTSLVGVNLTINGTFNTPNVTSLTNSILRLNGGSQFNSGLLTNIDNTRFFLSGGVVFDRVVATSYNVQNTWVDQAVISLTGVGTKLDLSSVKTFQGGYNYGWGGTQQIEAKDGALLDLSKLTLIDNLTYGTIWVRFAALNQGKILFTTLKKIQGTSYTDFDLRGESNPFPELEEISNIQATLPTGAALNFPKVTSMGSSNFTVPTGSAVSFPLLTTLKSLTLVLDGTFNVPLVTTLTYSSANLKAGSFFNTGMLSNINNTRFFLSGGVVFNRITATTYNVQETWVDQAVISLSGAGTKLDLSSVRTFQGGYNYPWGGTQIIEAKDGAILDLSNLTLIDNLVVGAIGVKFSATNGGKILLYSLQQMQGNIPTQFALGDEVNPFPQLATLTNSDFTVPEGQTLSLPSLTSTSGSQLRVNGILNAPLLTSLTNATLTITGNGRLNSGMLTNIDNTRFFLSGGAVFDKISATSYNVQNTWVDPAIISLSGAGTKLDLSSVKTFQGGYNYPWGGNQFVDVKEGATLDFSALTLIDNLLNTSIGFKFTALSGGKILFSSLQKIQGASPVQFYLDGDLNPLPVLTTMDRSMLTIIAGQTVSLPSLTTITTSSLFINGILNAPKVTSMTGSILNIVGPGKFNSGMLSNITNSRFFLSGGATFSKISAVTYNVQETWVDQAIIALSGAGTKLDLSSVKTFQGGYNYPWGGTQVIEVKDGAILDLSNLTLIDNLLYGSIGVRFSAFNGGKILFTSLQKIQGYITTIFSLDGEPNPFPVLTSFELSNYTVPAGQTVSLPSMTSIKGTSLVVNGILNAPNVTHLTSSSLTLTSAGKFNSGTLTNIDNTRFFLSGGAVFDRISATSYNIRNTWVDLPVISLTGFGTRLDLTSVTKFYGGYNYPWGGTQSLEAKDGAVLDLSNLAFIDNSLYGAIWVKFLASSTGKIFLSNVQTAAGPVNFTTLNKGFIDLASAKFLERGPFLVHSEDQDSLIQLGSLCSYYNATFERVNGGIVAHSASELSYYFARAISGLRTLPQSVQCSGDSCNSSSLFSVLPNGKCLREAGAIKYANITQLDADGLAINAAGLLSAFEILHAADSSIYGSRLISLDKRDGNVIQFGNQLSGRRITGAGFIGATLFAIDSNQDELLQLSTPYGDVIGSPIRLKLNGVNYDLSPVSDIALKPDGTATLVDGSKRYNLNTTTGALTLQFNDTAPFTDGLPAGVSGIAYTVATSDAAFIPYLLSTTGIDTLYSDNGTRALLPFSFATHTPSEGVLGDLAAVSKIDTTAPGQVSIVIDPTGSGTSMIVDWSSFDEVANGADIDHYDIYTSSSQFNNISTATKRGSTTGGVKNFVLSNLTLGQAIHVAVVAVDFVGNSSQNVTSVEGTPIDSVAPGNVEGLAAKSNSATSIVLSWTVAPGSSDLQSFKILNGSIVIADSLSGSARSYLVSGLSSSTQYTFQVIAKDITGNTNSGASVTTATWLGNPVTINATGYNNRVDVSWNGSSPYHLIKGYNIYAQTSPFTSVQGLQPILKVGNINSASILGLANGTTYFIGVSTVDIYDNENKVVVSAGVQPLADISGPSVNYFYFNGNYIQNYFRVGSNGAFTFTAQDETGVGRAEIEIRKENQTWILPASSVGNGSFRAEWNIDSFSEGNYSIVVRAFDTLNNVSESTFLIILQYYPPSAPTFTSPAQNTITGDESVTLTGYTDIGSTVQVYRAGIPLGERITPNALGEFSTTIQLVKGLNNLWGASFGRGGQSGFSLNFYVTLDPNVPSAIADLSAHSGQGGEIVLEWRTPSQSQSFLYNIYRSPSPFTNIGSAVKINSSPVDVLTFQYLPPTDETYFYRVSALSVLGTPGPLSNQVGASADRTGPSASIKYSTNGKHDENTNIYGVGMITVEIETTEPLSLTPFFSVTPNNGLPISVTLAKVAEQKYKGQFPISSSTPTGVAYAVFSGRDVIGNRGTEITVGETISIDTSGPILNSIQLTPGDPIENVGNVTAEAIFNVSEAPKAGQVPQVEYLLSGAGRVAQSISNLTEGNPNRKIWRGTFTLPNDAGSAGPETLSFIFSATDYLDNSNTSISAPNTFQVYQGTLPPVAVPSGLTAKSLPAGKILLQWNAVANASSYQLYRRSAASGGDLEKLGIPSVVTNYIDLPDTDGVYEYAVSSVRQIGAKISLSAPSSPVSVASDRSRPNAPQSLTTEIIGQGILAKWSAPQGGAQVNGSVTYSLYRAATAPGAPISTQGLTPLYKNIVNTEAVDPQPSATEHAYVVTAVDEADNESDPSSSSYLNVALLPVSQVQIVKPLNSNPIISWVAGSGTSTKFKLDSQSSAGNVKLFEGNQTKFTDSSYSAGERLYKVTAYDSNNVASVARGLLLSDISTELLTALPIKRGIFNSLRYLVTNNGTSPASNVELEIKFGTVSFRSDPFTLEGGAKREITVVLGGDATLSDSTVLNETVRVKPAPGETVEIVSERTVSVVSDTLLIGLETKTLVKGGEGNFRFTVENTSDATTEIILAKSNGQVSDEVRLKLYDSDLNVLTVVPLAQTTGGGVVTVSNGLTVARVQPGQKFTSQWFTIPVPASAPDVATLKLEIDRFHNGVGSLNASSIAGHGTNLAVTLTEAPYRGEITSITPQTSFGDVPITIIGAARETSSQELLPFSPLDLIIAVQGFERKFTVITGADGSFAYIFKPNVDEGGTYNVSAIYPGRSERPAQGSFVVQAVTVTPRQLMINAPTNYELPIDLVIKSAPGVSATNVHFELVADDQPLLALPVGIEVKFPPPVNLSPGESKTTRIVFSAKNNAVTSGSVRLRLMTTERGNLPQQKVTLNYVLSSAAPSIRFNPAILETGVKRGEVISESVSIENKGLAPLTNASLSLLKRGVLTPASDWSVINGPKVIDRLEIGESRTIQLQFSPSGNVSDGFYELVLRLSAEGEPTVDLPIVVTVTDSGVGNLLIHASDIYTATLDSNGQPILGLSGARIKIQNEAVPTIEFNGVTDGAGELLLSNLPAGSYLLRASSSDHDDLLTRMLIRPGITQPKEIFLMNSIVSIEWSVKEIPILDKYEIVLHATYQTDVPVAVLVIEPPSVELPPMKKGEVFYGEFSITNYGLIQAEEVLEAFPTSDDRAKYEFFTKVPEIIGAKDRVVVPYRITALRDFNPGAESDSSGGGACNYQQSACVRGSAKCRNGQRAGVGSCTSWLEHRMCGSVPPGGPVYAVGGYVPPGSITLSGGSSVQQNGCLPGAACSLGAATPGL